MKNRNSQIGSIIATLIEHPNITERLKSATLEAKEVLLQDQSKLAASITIQLELFGAELPSEISSSLESRWHVVPAGLWHQPTPGKEDWTVVAFHTISADRLVDDYDYKAC